MTDYVNRYQNLTLEELDEEYMDLITDEDISAEIRYLNWDLENIGKIWKGRDWIQYSENFRDCEPKQEQIEIIDNRIRYLKTKLLRDKLNGDLWDKNTTNKKTKI